MREDLPSLLPDGIVDYEPLADGYAIKLPCPFARTDVDQGPAVQDRLYRNAPSFFNVAWPMSDQAAEIYLGMLDESGGPFAWHLLLMRRPGGFETMKVRFVADPNSQNHTIALEDGEWIVRGLLETRSFRAYGPSQTALAVLTYGTDLTAMELDALLGQAWADIVEGCRSVP